MKDIQAFFSAIDRYTDTDADARAEVESDIWQRYGVDRAVLVLDMSAFSLSVHRDGVLSYLCRIRRMQTLTGPVVQAHGGEIIGYEADNLFASFQDADEALQAAVEMSALLSGDELAQAVSIGLSYGRILLIAGDDAYGDAVNIAFKLGEDIAVSGEILACPDFVQALRRPLAYAMETQTLSIAGLPSDAYRVSSRA